MKKLGTLFSIFILLTAFTCENEPLEGEFVDEGALCENAIDNAVTAALNFVAANDDNFTQLCNAYKNALEAQINACGDDANGSVQAAIDDLGDCAIDQPDDLVGTWLLTAWNGEEQIDLNNDGTESINFLDEMDCYNNETIVFNADNTGFVMSTSYALFDIFIEVGTTDSFDFTIDCIAEVENTDITWSQTGNIVSITDSTNETTDWTLAGNTLSITFPEGFSVTDPDDTTVTVTQDLTFVYTKQ